MIDRSPSQKDLLVQYLSTVDRCFFTKQDKEYDKPLLSYLRIFRDGAHNNEEDRLIDE